MPITTSCPGCKALFRLPDDLAGQEVRCQKCEQLFVVPMPTAGAAEPSIAVPESPSEAPAPAAPPEEAPSEATPAPQTPNEDIVMATVVEPKEEKPNSPPLPKTPPPAESPASVLGALALLLLFLMAMFGTGAFATIWIVMHLSPPLPITSAPPLHGPGDGNWKFEQKQDDPINMWPEKDKEWDKGKRWEKVGPFDKKGDRQPALPEPIGAGGRATIIANTEQAAWIDHGKWNQDGPYRLYVVHLMQGLTYNFYIGGLGFRPRLRIIDGEEVVADRSAIAAVNRGMFSYKPKRAGAHLLWVTTHNFVKGNFSLLMAPEVRANPVPVDLTLRPSYAADQALGLENPLDPGANGFGPCRDYEVKLDADKEYTISIVNAKFPPVLQVDDDKPVTSQIFNPILEHTIKSAKNGKYRLRVTSEQYGIGAYVLKIEPRPILLHRIIATLDDKGSFAEQRQLAPSDPQRAGRGSYKEYLLAGLEKGRQYRIVMSLGDSPTALSLIDPFSNEVKSVAGQKDASLTFGADHAGTYRLHVFAPLPKNRATYSLRITTEP